MDEAWIMHEKCTEEGNTNYLSYTKQLAVTGKP